MKCEQHTPSISITAFLGGKFSPQGVSNSLDVLGKGFDSPPHWQRCGADNLSVLWWGTEQSTGEQSQTQSSASAEKSRLCQERIYAVWAVSCNLWRKDFKEKRRKETMSNLHTNVLRGLWNSQTSKISELIITCQREALFTGNSYSNLSPLGVKPMQLYWTKAQ